ALTTVVLLSQISYGLRVASAPAFRPDKIRRKQRQGIAKGFVDLALREVPRVFEARACEVRPAELRTREIGALKPRVAKIRSAQIGTVKPRVAEIGT
ncbi:MAG: hypothetical protein V3V97_15940, partial [Hyphomicrobiaceae bacterium]